jgi:aminopeptidase YwaD
LGEIKGLATSLGIFPNPSNGEFTVSFDTDIKLDLVNELGQLIKVLNLTGANDYKVNVSGLSSGVYFLVNKNGTEKIERKIVVNK